MLFFANSYQRELHELREQVQQSQGLLTITQSQRKQLVAENDELHAKVASLSQAKEVLEVHLFLYCIEFALIFLQAPIRAELKNLQDQYTQLQAAKV